MLTQSVCPPSVTQATVPPSQPPASQALTGSQYPYALHACKTLPVHSVVPGTQTPEQDPYTHAALSQALPVFCQTPPSPHVCGCWPLHCVRPGAQLPWQAPLMHVALPQFIGRPHPPSGSQLCTPLPEHCVVPCVQGPAHVCVHSEHVPLAQGRAGSHTPWGLHICTPPSAEHRVVYGVQTQVTAHDQVPSLAQKQSQSGPWADTSQ
jgi:hypothetical protein